jgi:hypothetical protein
MNEWNKTDPLGNENRSPMGLLMVRKKNQFRRTVVERESKVCCVHVDLRGII